MKSSTLMIDHSALFLAQRRAHKRRVTAIRREQRPSGLQRLCRRFAPHAKREHTVRVPGGETIHSNIAS